MYKCKGSQMVATWRDLNMVNSICIEPGLLTSLKTNKHSHLTTPNKSNMRGLSVPLIRMHMTLSWEGVFICLRVGGLRWIRLD